MYIVTAKASNVHAFTCLASVTLELGIHSE